MAFLKLLLLTMAALPAFSMPAYSADDGVPYERIVPQQDDRLNGIFDVSVEYGADGVGWMAYSRVCIPKSVSTHLAKSTDRGASWNYVSSVNESYMEKMSVKGKEVDVSWRYETPSIVYDASDVPEKRWKLFVQKYYSRPPYKKGHSVFKDGWIEYKTAANPTGPWSEPICAFGPKEQGCKVQPNSLHPSLSENLFYNEIGVLSLNGVLYMSADASTTTIGLGEWKKRKVVLFSSKDHGNSWRYNGVLTDYKDASDFGYNVLTGSSLIERNGKPYLLVSPAGKKGLFVKSRAHAGCYIFSFNDLDHADLRRNFAGRLVVYEEFPVELKSGGLCDYHERNVNGGVLISQVNLKAMPEAFGVYNTYWMIP